MSTKVRIELEENPLNVLYISNQFDRRLIHEALIDAEVRGDIRYDWIIGDQQSDTLELQHQVLEKERIAKTDLVVTSENIYSSIRHIIPDARRVDLEWFLFEATGMSSDIFSGIFNLPNGAGYGFLNPDGTLNFGTRNENGEYTNIPSPWSQMDEAIRAVTNLLDEYSWKNALSEGPSGGPGAGRVGFLGILIGFAISVLASVVANKLTESPPVKVIIVIESTPPKKGPIAEPLPPEEEMVEVTVKPKKKKDEIEPGVQQDFLLLLWKVAEKTELDDLWKQIRDGNLSPELTDVHEDFVAWLQTVGFDDAAELIENNNPLSADDNNKYAFLYTIWQETKGTEIPRDPILQYLWRKGFPIDPIERTVYYGTAVRIGSKYDAGSDLLQLSFNLSSLSWPQPFPSPFHSGSRLTQ